MLPATFSNAAVGATGLGTLEGLSSRARSRSSGGAHTVDVIEGLVS